MLDTTTKEFYLTGSVTGKPLSINGGLTGFYIADSNSPDLIEQTVRSQGAFTTSEGALRGDGFQMTAFGSNSGGGIGLTFSTTSSLTSTFSGTGIVGSYASFSAINTARLEASIGSLYAVGLGSGFDSIEVVGDSFTDPVLGSDYAAWVLANFGSAPILADVSPYAAPEGDGIANIQEYARDTDPNSPTQPISLDISNELSDPISATLTFEVASDVTEVVSVVEYSKDLEGWLSDGIVLSESSSGSQVSITATLVGSMAESPLFMRVTWVPAPD